MNEPIVVGAGPAGSAAAIALARAGKRPILIDRDAVVGDCICGGFLSWETAARLRDLGCDPESLGAHRVDRLRLFAGSHRAKVPLVAPGYGISRRALDTALRAMAVASGAELAIDRVRAAEPGKVVGERREWRSGTIFLASGKHDVRGAIRPRAADDSALGLRIRIPEGATTKSVSGTIELHFFDGGYAGIVVQEDGSVNVCLALRKSRFGVAGGDRWGLLRELAKANPAFGERIAAADPDLPVDAIGAVPYGWIARSSAPGLYRLGDQAAVIPSLAGEGMAIALESAARAVEAHLAGRSADDYQRAFHDRARRPVRTAGLIWKLAERPIGAQALTTLSRYAPKLSDWAMRLSRI